jgi:hypothetical protein
MSADLAQHEPYRLSIAGDCAQAVELWDQIGCPYEAALALADGDQEGTVRGALDELMELGARAAASIFAQRLRQRGVRRSPSA